MNPESLTAPLSPIEREDFRKRFENRIETVKAKTADVFAFKKVDRPPIVVNSAFYWVFGLDPETFPADYFSSAEVMTHFQERCYYDQIREIEDDFVPYLMPWFGTGVTASAFGCQIVFPPKQDPAVDPRRYPVKTAADVRRLEIPDPEKNGLMPKVLDFMGYMKAHSFLPIGITDFQGPLTTANQLMGYDKLIYLMQDDPVATHELMDKITEALVRWVKKQKEIVGEPVNQCISDQQVYTGRHAGIWFSDDDAVLMSVKTYREFVVPYNSRILQEFGGGCLHYCGCATHQADNFLATEGLLAINNYLLHDTRRFHALRAKLRGRIALFACDFTPIDFESYFHQLLDDQTCEGLVVHSQYSPVVGLLSDGKYSALRRDLRAGRRSVYECLSRFRYVSV